MPTEPKIWRWEGQLDNPGDLVFAFGNRRRIGITTTELTNQLADFFGIADGRGVLVTSVTENGPAAKAGLKAGDVITAVDGEKVDSTGDISRVVNNKKEGDVTLTVFRNKTQQTIRVTPEQRESLQRTIKSAIRQQVRSDIGRQIVIPRIQFPVIPELNISIPSIQIPSVPPVNIQIPRAPCVRVVRTPRVI